MRQQTGSLVEGDDGGPLHEVGGHQSAHLTEEFVAVVGMLKTVDELVAEHVGYVFVLYVAEVGQQTDELVAVVVNVEVLLQGAARGDEEVVVQVVVLAFLPQQHYLLDGCMGFGTFVLWYFGTFSLWYFGTCAAVCLVGGFGWRVDADRPVFEKYEEVVERHHGLLFISRHSLVEEFLCGGVVVGRGCDVDTCAVDRKDLLVGVSRHGIVDHHTLGEVEEDAPWFLGIGAVGHLLIEAVAAQGGVVFAEPCIERLAQLVLQEVLLAVVEHALQVGYLVHGIAGQDKPKFLIGGKYHDVCAVK